VKRLIVLLILLVAGCEKTDWKTIKVPSKPDTVFVRDTVSDTIYIHRRHRDD
jgi:hypothetical protein